MELQVPFGQASARAVCPPLLQVLVPSWKEWVNHAESSSVTQFVALHVKIMPVGAAWGCWLLPPLYCCCVGWQAVCDDAVENLVSHCACEQHWLSWRQGMLLHFTERYEFSFSASLCPCKSHGTLTYTLKILNLQFSLSWLCCALRQGLENLCHGTRDPSAGEVDCCSGLSRILR